MITLTRLDGTTVFVNEHNIQWIEALPDTAITFVAGARLLVRENVATVLRLTEAAAHSFSGEAMPIVERQIEAGRGEPE